MNILGRAKMDWWGEMGIMIVSYRSGIVGCATSPVLLFCTIDLLMSTLLSLSHVCIFWGVD